VKRPAAIRSDRGKWLGRRWRRVAAVAERPGGQAGGFAGGAWGLRPVSARVLETGRALSAPWLTNQSHQPNSPTLGCAPRSVLASRSRAAGLRVQARTHADGRLTSIPAPPPASRGRQRCCCRAQVAAGLPRRRLSERGPRPTRLQPKPAHTPPQARPPTQNGVGGQARAAAPPAAPLTHLFGEGFVCVFGPQKRRRCAFQCNKSPKVWFASHEYARHERGVQRGIDEVSQLRAHAPDYGSQPSAGVSTAPHRTLHARNSDVDCQSKPVPLHAACRGAAWHPQAPMLSGIDCCLDASTHRRRCLSSRAASIRKAVSYDGSSNRT
jgi:hypothetical protein